MAEMDTHLLPNNLTSALELRAREGLSFSETASLTGVVEIAPTRSASSALSANPGILGACT